jgi:DNA primase
VWDEPRFINVICVGRHSDCLDYLVQHRGLGFMEALCALAAETGVPMPGWSPEQAEAEAKRVVERRRIEALLTEAAGYYHRVLPSKIRRELYGRHYGFTVPSASSGPRQSCPARVA